MIDREPNSRRSKQGKFDALVREMQAIYDRFSTGKERGTLGLGCPLASSFSLLSWAGEVVAAIR